MPFTPSHAVVALPFVRTPLVPAAVAIGAMTPDLPLFLRGLGLRYSVTHDLRWLPLTIIVALVLLLGWRCVLRPAVRELSPRRLAARLPSSWDGGARAALHETFSADAPANAAGARVRVALLLVASLAIGVVSHVLWDLFTHEGRAGVAAFPLLAQHWGPLVGFKWLQHGSSVVGIAVIGAWALTWLARRVPAVPGRRLLPGWVRWAWWVSLPLVLTAALAVGLALYGPLSPDFTAQHLAYAMLPPACGMWGVATALLCLGIQVARGAAERRGSGNRT